MGFIIQDIMTGLIVFAMPVILMLLLLEFGINIMARVSEQIKTPTIDFLIKNLALTLALPVMVFGLMRLMQKAFDETASPLPLLLRFLSS